MQENTVLCTIYVPADFRIASFPGSTPLLFIALRIAIKVEPGNEANFRIYERLHMISSSFFRSEGACIVVNGQSITREFSHQLYNPQCFMVYEDPTIQPPQWEVGCRGCSREGCEDVRSGEGCGEVWEVVGSRGVGVTG